MNAKTEPPTSPVSHDEPWFDELVRESDDWMIATVTTPRGKRIRYRLMVRNHA